MDAFLSALATIKKTNGYETDVGLNIYEWREEPFDASFSEAINVRELEVVLGRTHDGDDHVLNVELEVHTTGPNAIRTYRAIKGDVMELIRNNIDWGGLASDTKMQNEEIGESAKEENRIGNFLIPVQIEFTTEYMNPYQ